VTLEVPEAAISIPEPVVALSLAGVLGGAGVRFWKDWAAIDLFFVGPLWLALVVHALLRVPLRPSAQGVTPMSCAHAFRNVLVGVQGS
jgi:hypothetical protein